MKFVKLLCSQKPAKTRKTVSIVEKIHRKNEAKAKAKSGLWGEDVAVDFLKKKKYKIAARRFKIGRDEIDIIAVPRNEKRTIIFVEVKTRKSTLFGGPIAAIGLLKRRALCRAAAHYLQKFPPPTPAFRFDAISVIGSPETGAIDVKHIENIFPMSLHYAVSFLHSHWKT